jgi:hypothetical protein
MVREKNLISLKNEIMKKLLFTTLAGLGVALLIGGSTGVKAKFHPGQNTAMTILDTVPDSPKKIQLVYSRLDTVPDSPKKIQLVYYKLDTVPDSPKKANLVAMR